MLFWITGALMACALISAPIACKSGRGQYNPTTGVYDTAKEGDPFVVNAQRTRGIALEVFDGFMKLERENEAALLKVSPAIHSTAEEIRRNGKTWLQNLSEATAAYQGARTDGSRSRLLSALAVVQSAIASAQSYIAKAAQVGVK